MNDSSTVSPITFSLARKAPFEPPPQGSRRRRLWDLPHSCHCPVVGVCLPMDQLRKLVNRLMSIDTAAGDYELHVGVVAECTTRNRVTEALQRELDRRYAIPLRRFAQAKTTDAVGAAWDEAVASGDVAGALWSALTHARCDGVLQERVCREIHMIQHQAGAAVRADLRRLQALSDENAVLTRELARVQTRATQWQGERIAEVERLHGQLMLQRTRMIEQDALIAALREQLALQGGATADAAAGDSRAQWTQRITELGERVRELERALAAERAQPLAAAETGATLAAQAPAAERQEQPADELPPAELKKRLEERCVLCVGGRNGHVPVYRELVERHGGRFVHHDGGLEDNARRLDANLSAADLVICQTGCLSHSAYWLVKDHCKRTGKRRVYVDKPGLGSFLRGLAQLPADTTLAQSPHAFDGDTAG